MTARTAARAVAQALGRYAAFDDYDSAVEQARYALPKPLWDNVFPAHSGRGVTFRDNVDAYDDIRFRPRAATAFGVTDLTTTVLGTAVSMPAIVAPVGNLRLMHPAGALAAGRAAAAVGTICTVSMSAGHSITEVARVADGPLWQQFYLSHGRDAARRVIAAARDANAAALMITVDCPVRPRKAVDLSVSLRTASQFGPSLLARPGWTTRFVRDGAQLAAARAAVGPETGEPVQWEDLEWIRDQWDGPLIVKGIMSAADARRAVDHGAAAVVVSNHGGLVLDGSPASVAVLPEVVAEVGGTCEVLVDGGVRQGSDVVKAVALGARAVLVGRAYLAGLAVGGEVGVRQALTNLSADMVRTLALLGCPSVSDLGPEYLYNATAVTR